MNSIITDPVSDQTGCLDVCNGNNTEVNRKDCAAVLRSDDRDAKMHHRYLQKPQGAGDEWNPAANRVLIDSRSKKMIIPSDADRG